MAVVKAASRTLISPAQLNRPTGKAAYWFTFCLVTVVFALVFLFPLYWMFAGGLKSPQEIIQIPPTLLPSHPHLGNYSTAWSEADMGQLLWNTTFYAGGALAFQLVFDIGAAYAFSKLRPAFGGVILFGMMATLMIPTSVLALPTYLTANSLPFVHWSLLNTPWVIWLPSVASNAFSIVLLKRFFDSIPAELLAAASIDGAGPLRALWSVVLPMSRPILGVVSIFAVVNVWKDFLWPLLVLTNTSDQTINIGLFQLSVGLPENILIAALAIASIPTIVFFLIFQRNIMSGLTAGSLKG
jgi:multiple sugar transport system permease protein